MIVSQNSRTFWRLLWLSRTASRPLGNQAAEFKKIHFLSRLATLGCRTTLLVSQVETQNFFDPEK
jgi:hypothetical protein